jgi:hypothetical protein
MSSRVAAQRRRLAVRLTVAALVWSLGLVLAALLVPVYDGTASSSEGLTLTRSTLVQVNGTWALILVVVPVILSLVVAASIYRGRRGAAWSTAVAWIAIGLLTAVALLGILTIGAFMLPVAILLALSVRLDPGSGSTPDAPTRALATGT